MNEDPLLGGTVWMRSPTGEEISPVPQRLYQQRLQEGWKKDESWREEKLNSQPQWTPPNPTTPMPSPMKLGGPQMGIEDMMGLGGFMQPQAGAQPDPAQQPDATPDGGWTAFLNDPVKRAGLLSFGLQAMTGGWGNGTQQLAAALGAGASGMASTAGHLQDTAEKNRAFAAKEHEGEANRASHEKIANITGDSRTEVASIRAQASIDRALITHPPQNNVEQKFYQESLKEVRKTIEGDLGSLKLSDDQREKLIRARALERLDEARQKGMFGNSANGVGATPGAASTPPGTPPAGTAPNATSETPKGASFDQLRSMPGFDEKMADPAWRAQLLKARPDLSTRIQLYDREMTAKGARKNLYGME